MKIIKGLLLVLVMFFRHTFPKAYDWSISKGTTFMGSNLRQVRCVAPCTIVWISKLNNYTMLSNLKQLLTVTIEHKPFRDFSRVYYKHHLRAI